jgi:hypothetical protein
MYTEPKTSGKQGLVIRVETREGVDQSERNDVSERIIRNIVNDPAAEDIVRKQSDLSIEFAEKGHLFDGWEKYQKPGKIIRLIKA